MPSSEMDTAGRDDLERVIRGLADIAAALKRIRLPPGEGLGARHGSVLTMLHLEGPMSVGELGQALAVELTTASLLVRELADSGLVVRREDPADRRRTLVAVAPAAGRRVARWLDDQVEPVRVVLDSLTPDQRRVVARVISEMGAGLRKHWRDRGER